MRALRRHHKQRMKAKARRVYSIWQANSGLGASPEEIRDQTILTGDTLKGCSCHMCGNRRKYEGLTLQEIKFNEFANVDYGGKDDRPNRSGNC